LKILENLKAKLADSIKEYQKAAELLNKGTTTTAKK
jgi:exonuclease VII small subunit